MIEDVTTPTVFADEQEASLHFLTSNISNDMQEKEDTLAPFSLPEGITAEDLEPSEEMEFKMDFWQMGEDLERLKNEMKEVKKLLGIK